MSLRLQPANATPTFRVGASIYSVVIAREIEHEGDTCLGLCREFEETITLSAAMPAHKRLNVLLHELAHAHVYATGYPRDIESLCDLFATIATLAFRDLAACGGEEAIVRLGVGEELRRSPEGRRHVG